jgi:DNA-binding beta-propeller fold protein YncE
VKFISGKSAISITFAIAASLLVPAVALSAGPDDRPGGSILQLPGKNGCLVDRSSERTDCTKVRALKTPGPFMGSQAMAISPDGSNLYVASSGSNAITVFSRDTRTGRLTQPAGQNGCVAAKGNYGCAEAWGLSATNSVGLSPDGRFLYASSRNSSTVTVFRRNTDTGALQQLAGSRGCISGTGLPGCGSARGLNGPDVVAVSPDGLSVYLGSFTGSAIAVFQRDRQSGQLTQAGDETGCVTAVPTTNCSTALAMSAIEGLAVSGDGASVFAAAAGSNAVLAFARNPVDGSLAQVAGGLGCVTYAALEGCAIGRQIEGANAVVVSPDDSDVYATSLISSSTASFTRSVTTGGIQQLAGALGCSVWLGAQGCYPARGMRSPEGIALSPDGLNVYVAAYGTGGVAVLNRNPATGGIGQKRAQWGCVSSSSTDTCARGRALSGAGGIAVSPNGRFVYTTAANANAIAVFERKQNGS